MRLLLLEDDMRFGEALVEFLKTDGHVVDWFRRLADVPVVRGALYDALLVDWQLPDGSGIGWIRTVRQQGSAVPAIVLTARDLISDRIQGLDSGADDYLVKPFNPEELSARLRAVTRRASASGSSRQQFGDVELDLTAKCAYVGTERMDLTGREWAIVEALALRAGRFVDKSTLEDLVLGADAEVASNALDVHVSSIRRKLGRRAIETMRGLGYRMSP